MEKGLKSCYDCDKHDVCKVRSYFLTAFGDQYIREITTSPDEYAKLVGRMRFLLGENCQFFGEETN